MLSTLHQGTDCLFILTFDKGIEGVLKLWLLWQRYNESRQASGEKTHAAEPGTSANENVHVMFKLKSTCTVTIHSCIAQQ